MKQILLTSMALIVGMSMGWAQTSMEPAANAKTPEFKFEKEVHDFGNVREGDKVSYDFKFTNTGKTPLVISGVQASCGCTTPRWPKEPILPGETGIITAEYNSAGRPNAFNKAITVTSNAATPRKVLYIKGNVISSGSEETLPLQNNSGPKEKGNQ